MTDERGVRMLSAEEVLELWGLDTDLFLLDVREPEEWEIHHIPGATLIPMRSLAARLSELDPQRETVVICEHGMRSKSVAQFLVAQAKFQKVSNMVGGMSAWNGPVETGA